MEEAEFREQLGLRSVKAEVIEELCVQVRARARERAIREAWLFEYILGKTKTVGVHNTLVGLRG